MDNPGYIALSRQLVLERQMAVVANNIANQTTVGYRREGLLFRDFMVKPTTTQAADQQYEMVEDWATWRDTREGALSPTGNPLDVALAGPGYLRVQGEDGTSYYTRGGRMSRSAEGQLVNRDGLPVLDAAGAPITLPQGDVTIAEDGAISSNGVAVGRIGMFEFDDPQALTSGPAGGLFAAAGEAKTATQTRMSQGFVEESNVQPVVELTQMIELSRQYQANLRLIEAEGERQRAAITKLTRLA